MCSHLYTDIYIYTHTYIRIPSTGLVPLLEERPCFDICKMAMCKIRPFVQNTHFWFWGNIHHFYVYQDFASPIVMHTFSSLEMWPS